MAKRGIAILHKLFNKIYMILVDIYDIGLYPVQWLKSTFISLPKKKNAKKCEDHRLMNLMSHALKLFLKILHQRIYRKRIYRNI